MPLLGGEAQLTCWQSSLLLLAVITRCHYKAGKAYSYNVSQKHGVITHWWRIVLLHACITQYSDVMACTVKHSEVTGWFSTVLLLREAQLVGGARQTQADDVRPQSHKARYPPSFSVHSTKFKTNINYVFKSFKAYKSHEFARAVSQTRRRRLLRLKI